MAANHSSRRWILLESLIAVLLATAALAQIAAAAPAFEVAVIKSSDPSR
jgi:hypothetical protein